MIDTIYGSFSDDYEIRPLKDICQSNGIQTGPFGSLLHQKDYLIKGTPIITVEHLGDNRIIHSDLPCVSDEDKNRLSKFIMKTGDIIFSRVGSVDRRSLVRDEENNWLFSGRCLRIRPDQTKVDSRFLSWFFGLEVFKDYIRKIAVGATMPSLNTELLSNIPIIIPPLPEQRAIADVLSSLDDKIELNRRMNKTLEELAQTLFKHWFVDNPEREVWKEGTFSDFATVAIGGDWGNDHSSGNDSQIICMRGVDLEHLRTDGYSEKAPIRWIKNASLQKRQLSECDILIAGSGIGPVGRSIWINQKIFSLYQYSISYSNFCKRITAKSPAFALLLDRMFFNMYQSKRIMDYVNGTSLPNLDINALMNQCVVKIPPDDLVQKYYSIIEPFYLVLFNGETQVLANIRDLLLPNLMSGKLRVRISENQL